MIHIQFHLDEQVANAIAEGFIRAAIVLTSRRFYRTAIESSIIL